VLNKILLKKAVIALPKKADKQLLKGTNLKIEASFSYYIHKSLTKQIVVLQK
jgi:tRNA G10  N-methylase Trm11